MVNTKKNSFILQETLKLSHWFFLTCFLFFVLQFLIKKKLRTGIFKLFINQSHKFIMHIVTPQRHNTHHFNVFIHYITQTVFSWKDIFNE